MWSWMTDKNGKSLVQKGRKRVWHEWVELGSEEERDKGVQLSCSHLFICMQGSSAREVKLGGYPCDMCACFHDIDCMLLWVFNLRHAPIHGPIFPHHKTPFIIYAYTNRPILSVFPWYVYTYVYMIKYLFRNDHKYMPNDKPGPRRSASDVCADDAN